ncbi:MAG: alanine racemase [Anaerolineae bacterium]|nr:alanine racemase [Anaerolineae bacterium]
MILLSDLLNATGGRLHGPVFADHFADFCFDSRLLHAGELFLAVKTETGDGHDYILDVTRDGAAGVLCQHPLDLSSFGVTCIVVEDVRQALLDWAAHILQHYAPRVVAVTGSSGKTMTKDAGAAVLAARFPVFKTPASYSGRYGLPIALGRLGPEHEIAVLELAAASFDEVRDLAALTRPTVGIVTSVHEAHLAFFGDLDTIAREKGRLVEALPADGLALLNADDPRVLALRERTRARVLTFGRSPEADLRATNIHCTPAGVSFTLIDRGTTPTESPIHLRLLGPYAVYPALAALGVGLHSGVPLADACAALAGLAPLPGRLNPLSGLGGSLILDDTVSATPATALAALEALACFRGRRRLAVLGDMEDLGDYEAEGHRKVGEAAVGMVETLVTVGERARGSARAARAAGLPASAIFETYSIDEAARYLAEHLGPGTVLLVKGGREARLERLVARLLAPGDAARAGELLVRQGAGTMLPRLSAARPDRPTWLEIDLNAIANNVRRAQEVVGPGVGILTVLKADGYGHGAAIVGRTALNNGATMLGVACLAEAINLRRAGLDAPLLVLGYTPAWQARETLLHRVIATVFDLDSARAFSRAATELRQTARLHVKVDTGMGRLGLLPGEVLPFVRLLRELPGVEVEGIFTHFSVADAADKGYTYEQLAAFHAVLDALDAEGLRPPLVHAANSAALLTVRESRFNLVRLGLALYGLAPSPETPLPPGFRPALTWKTQIAQVKTLPPGSYVSYGNTYRTQGEERIAVIPVGYADGFRRAPAHWGEVLVRGQRASIVGRVCMDQTMLDVTHIPHVRQGDEVVLIGAQGDDRITVEEVAARLGTINYEVVSEILARVPRVV